MYGPGHYYYPPPPPIVKIAAKISRHPFLCCCECFHQQTVAVFVSIVCAIAGAFLATLAFALAAFSTITIWGSYGAQFPVAIGACLFSMIITLIAASLFGISYHVLVRGRVIKGRLGRYDVWADAGPPLYE